MLNGYMAEVQPQEARIASLQQEAGSLLHSPRQPLDGGSRLTPSEEQLTPQEIKQRFTFDVNGEKTSLPDYLKGHLPQLLDEKEAGTLGIDTAKPITPDDQLKIVKHLLKKLEENPQEIAKIKRQFTELSKHKQVGAPQIIASLQVIGIEALQQQYTQTQGENKSSPSSPDTTFGEGSRRKVYTRMGGVWDEVTLKGDAMKAFEKTSEGTPRLNTTVEMDLRLAQSLFNAAL
ncbi:MAG: hypothetical protein Q7K43_05815, partial [Candidatus Woesearchaeota archaeon]|nr:hypothetical protein [Candidatus Woesearchaeota archaeon]